MSVEEPLEHRCAWCGAVDAAWCDCCTDCGEQDWRCECRAECDGCGGRGGRCVCAQWAAENRDGGQWATDAPGTALRYRPATTP